MKKILFSFLIFIIIVCACIVLFQAVSHKQLVLPESLKPAPKTFSTDTVLGSFSGTLPCANCSGIQTTLTLFVNRNSQSPGTYVLEETYPGAITRTFITRGTWGITHGMQRNPAAVVYIINPDKSGRMRFFLKIGNNSVRMLDQAKSEIKSSFNLTLSKQPQKSVDPAVNNCMLQGGFTLVQKDKMNKTYTLCEFSDGQTCEEWALLKNHTCQQYTGGNSS